MEEIAPNRRFRCFAEERDGVWTGYCLDFDLAVDGRSLEEVIGSLNAAIRLYLEEVGTLPEADRRRLLHRRAPLSLRLRFLWLAVVRKAAV